MARRAGRKGDYLSTDDYLGWTVYASQLQRDYWGAFSTKPLQRNLQEIASPLNDPEPVSDYSGPAYEQISTSCIGENAPIFVGVTTVKTNQNNAAFQALNLHPGIGQMSVGCSFEVY